MDAIVAQAKADGTYLKAPNGKPTNLTPEQWALVRTKNFKRWFGDWEKAAQILKLRTGENARITGNEFGLTSDDKANKKAAFEFAKALQGRYTNADSGLTIQLQRGRKNGGIKEVLQHDYKNREHLLSVAAIPQIIEKGIIVASEANQDAVKNPSITEFQHLVCGLIIGDGEYTVHALIGIDEKGDRYYDHSLVNIEKTKLLDLADQAELIGGFGTTPSTRLTTSFGYKVSDIISILQNNSSKVVDENGEPKVMYHGSDWAPLEEEAGDAVFRMRNGMLGRGAYFTDDLEMASEYADEKLEGLPEELHGEERREYLEDNYVTDYFLNVRDEKDIVSKGNSLIVIARTPNQIKSATDNNGDFSQENNDIRFHAAGEQARVDADVQALFDGETGEVTLGDETIAVNTGEGPRFNVRTWEDGGRDALGTYLDKQVKAKKFTKEEAANLLSEMDRLTSMAKELADGNPSGLFGQWAWSTVRTKDGTSVPVLHALKDNAEYSLNIDFSTVCKKRQVIDNLFNRMINEGQFQHENLSPADIARINQIIQKHGLEIACGICFVDSRRYNAYQFANGFLDKFNPLVAGLVRGVDSKAPWTENVDKVAGFNYSNDAAFSNEGKSDPSAVDEVPDWTAIMQSNPELEKLWNVQKGAAGAKANEGNAQYLGDILDKAVTKDIYDIAGYRMQSFSDFIGRMYFDYLQAFADLAARQLPGHAYTKEPPFVKLFNRMGMKINMSLVSQVDPRLKDIFGEKAKDYAGLTVDGSGNLVYDFNVTIRDAEGNIVRQGQTFPPEEAFRLQSDPAVSRTAGTIAVGLSREHILRMLRDFNIRMVIPYHKSGLPHGVALIYNLDEVNDYTDSQNTRGKESLNGEEKDAMHARVDNYNFTLHQLSVAEDRLAAYNALRILQVEEDASKVKDVHQRFSELYEGIVNGTITEGLVDRELSTRWDSDGFLPKAAADIYLEACDRWGYVPKFDEFRGEQGYYKTLIDFSVYDSEGEYAPQEAIHFEVPENALEVIGESLAEDEAINERERKEMDSIIEDVNAYLGEKELRAEQDRISAKAAADVTGPEREYMQRDIFNVGDPRNIPARVSAHVIEAASQEGEGVRGSLKDINEEFNKNLTVQIKGHDGGPGLPRTFVYQLGMPSRALLEGGVENLPIEMSPQTLEIKSSSDYHSSHPFPLEKARNLVAAIQEPVAIFDSEEKNGKKVILTEIKSDSGSNFIAIIDLVHPRGRSTVEINSIISLYPKDSVARIAKWFDSEFAHLTDKSEYPLLKWADTKKANRWLANYASDVRTVGLSPKRIANIINSFESKQFESEFKDDPIRSHVTPEQDAEYMDAVESGDMETAQKMVNAAALANGYNTDNSWRMEHKAPTNNGYNVNLTNMSDLVPDDFLTHPEYYGSMSNVGMWEAARNLRDALSRYNRLVAEGNQEEADKVTITMYRGVDKNANKKESQFRNGDWITPSYEYAKISGTLGATRVIKEDVPIKSAWFDGNYLTEWGFDDGNEYAYKDTKNNRKLLDPVTRDDNGNVIPLSKRFNEKKADPRFSTAYHGSAADFDRFESGHELDGEGAMAHGYGTYVTFDVEVGRAYADKLAAGNVTWDGLDSYTSSHQTAEFVINNDYHGNIGLAKKSLMMAWPRDMRPEYARIIINSDAEDWKEGDKQRNLYSVEVPDDNGRNYLDSDKVYRGEEARELKERVSAALSESGVDVDRRNGVKMLRSWSEEIDGMNEFVGWYLYELLTMELAEGNTSRFDEMKAASDILASAGFVGLKYNGRKDGECAVIFNPDDVEIKEHVRYSTRKLTPNETRNRIRDHVNSVLTGRTEAESRAERRGAERAAHERFANLADAVLKNGFDDVTLRELDQYIDDAYRDQRLPLFQRVPQEVGRSLRSRAGKDVALDSLLGRIAEGSVSPAGRTGEDARRAAQERKNEILEAWAKATGDWHEGIEDFTDEDKFVKSGSDSDVYYSRDGRTVIKFSHGKTGKRFNPDIDNVALFNYSFPNAQYSILGYGEKDGRFVRILQQPTIEFGEDAYLDREERDAYMAGMGFRPTKDGSSAYTNGEIIAADIQKSNIVRDSEGDIRVIDADMKLHTRDLGGSYVIPPYSRDVSIPRAHAVMDAEESASASLALGDTRARVETEGLRTVLGDAYNSTLMDIYRAMPEAQRRAVLDGMDISTGRIGDATAAYLSELAGRPELTGSEQEAFDAAAQVLGDALGQGVPGNDAKWMFYADAHPAGSDFLDTARRTLVAARLGQTPAMRAMDEAIDERARMHTVSNAANQSAADIYGSSLGVWSAIRESHYDMYTSVANMLDAIVAKTGMPVADHENILLALNQLSSKNFSEKDAYIRDFLEPMWDTVRAIVKYGRPQGRRIDLDECVRYVELKHGVERNDVFSRRDARADYQQAHDARVKQIAANSSLTDAQKKADIAQADADLQNNLAAVNASAWNYDALSAAHDARIQYEADVESIRQNASLTPEAQSEVDAIVAQAKADGTYPKAPNGKPTNLTPEQWALVRTKNFKRWFGDWEGREFLFSDRYVSRLAGNEFEKDETPITEKVAKFYKENYDNHVERDGIGTVILDNRSVKDSISHGIGRNKAAAFAAVPDVIKSGIEIDRQRNWKGRGYDSVTIAAPISINEEGHVAVVILTQSLNSNRFYLHEVVLQKNLQDEGFKTGTKADLHQGDIANVIRNFLNTSKVVDENGEPKVVYHGTTAADRYVFEHGHKRDDYSYGTSTRMFSDTREVAEGYAKNNKANVVEAFLNIRNPKIKDYEGAAWNGSTDHSGKFQIVPLYDKVYSSESEAEADLQKMLDKYYPNDPEKQQEERQYMYVFEQMDLAHEGETTNDFSKEITDSKEFDGGIAYDVKDYYDVPEDEELRKIVLAPHTDYFVKESNQIKSATDNNGDFSQENNDIRFHAAGDAQARVDANVTDAEREYMQRDIFNVGDPRNVPARISAHVTEAASQDGEGVSAETDT